jgi:hypothetical protein
MRPEDKPLELTHKLLKDATPADLVEALVQYKEDVQTSLVINEYDDLELSVVSSELYVDNPCIGVVVHLSRQEIQRILGVRK